MWTRAMPPHHNASPQTLKEVRIRLLQEDLSFAAYCREKGYTRQNLAAALSGKWKGQKAQQLVCEVLSDLGIAA